MSYNIIIPTQTKTTQFGGSKKQGSVYDDLYDSYSKFTKGELEDLLNNKLSQKELIEKILEDDGQWVGDEDGDVSFESLWTGMRNKLQSDLISVRLEIEVISNLINKN